MPSLENAAVLPLLLVPVIVGFVTTSIKSYIDRIFLVLLALFFLKFGAAQAILVNLVVMFLASLFFYARNESALRKLPRQAAWWVIAAALLGAALGRWIALQLPVRVFLIVLGLYAILVGLRLGLVKIKPPARPAEAKPSVAWLSGIFAVLTGLISAGGKPFQVPLLVMGVKLAPPPAYLLASLGTFMASLGALGAQLLLAPGALNGSIFLWAVYFYVAITAVALIVERFWTPKLQQVVTYLIAPLLVLAGIRLLMMR
ncbi:MAG: TSUP family transporter [Firmicutes bacterium]|nr:TSUP family transporter [Bacillota bacterium]